MKGWVRVLFNIGLLCICVCTACTFASEALLWTNRVSTYVDDTVEVEYEGYTMFIYTKDAFHYEYENQVMEYDYKTGSIHTYPVSEGELSNLIMIDGNDNGNPIVAAKDNAADEWVLCAWKDGRLGKPLASFPKRTRNDESIDEITDILAWRDGWAYLGISRYALEDGMFFEQQFVRVKENQYQLLGTQKIEESDSYSRAAVSKAGSIAYWNQMGDRYGISVVQPVDGKINTAFIPIFECGDRIWSYNNEKYYMPAIPVIWMNERSILCFAVRTLAGESVSYNDAFEVDGIECSVTPFRMADGAQLSIPNRALGAGSAIINDELMVISAYHDPCPYWISFEGTPSADAFFKISLKTGELDLLSAPSEDSFFETDSIIVWKDFQ